MKDARDIKHAPRTGGEPDDPSRRQALGCLATWTGAAVLWTVAGGVPRAMAAGAPGGASVAGAGTFAFVQISDTHIGFNKVANPDVVGSLRSAIAGINALPQRPPLVLHTGDISHLSRPEEFGQARELFQEIRTGRLHAVPGEHDALDDGLSGYLAAFDHDGLRRPWYSFDEGGVHFIGLSNVLGFRPGTLTELGREQLDWLARDLAPLARSTPLVVFAHIPLWTVYAPWGWGTADADAAMALLRPFGSVTVLNGHVHQVLQKVEGDLTLQTAMSLAYPLPTPGQEGIGEPGPLTVPAGELGRRLGIRQLALLPGAHRPAVVDQTLDQLAR